VCAKISTDRLFFKYDILKLKYFVRNQTKRKVSFSFRLEKNFGRDYEVLRSFSLQKTPSVSFLCIWRQEHWHGSPRTCQQCGQYGALSDDSGCVEVGWSLEPKEGGRESFMISWHEPSEPAVTAPSRAGFGSIVLCRVARESLDIQVELNYASMGLAWRLQCPAGEVREVGLGSSRPPF
jgi:hypothetical protein